MRSFIALALLGAVAFVPSLAPVSATGPFTVPGVSYVTATALPGQITPAIHNVCLVRSETAGSQVTQSLMCYTTLGSDPAPPPPPPPYEQAYHDVIVAELNETTGGLTAPLLPCFEALSGFLAIGVDLVVPLDKAGGPVAGSVIVTEDFTAPFDCVGATQITGPLTLTPLAQSHDEDQDGCSDWEELGDNQVAGGLRDPFNFWDFYDVPTGTWPNLARDGEISGLDLFALIGRMMTWGDPDVDPLSLPPATGYHPAYDRGASAVGPDVWNLDKADGGIGGVDLSAMRAQFSHSCTAAP